VPVGSYELVLGSHPFVGGLAARSQCRNSRLAGDGAELCRFRAFQAKLRQSAGAMVEKKLSASTVNVRLSAVRKLVGEARRNGIIDAEEAANLAGVPNLSQKGTRLGNWLTRDQAKELLTVPDRSKIKGERDYAILALLLGCALRRQELASLDIGDIQLREGRWVVADLRGKGGRVRTVAIPLWVKKASDG
jgi:site-specific recombinase XerD